MDKGKGTISEPRTPSPEKKCAICLNVMKAGHGHAMFTAECSHTFHFHCITSNVKHGNYICPLCRAKWKELPLLGSISSANPHDMFRLNPVDLREDHDRMVSVSRPGQSGYLNWLTNWFTSHFHAFEPNTFNDDEPLDMLSETANDSVQEPAMAVDITTYTEFSAVPQSASLENFNVLIHLKAPNGRLNQISTENLGASSSARQNSRAPIDLVTVLDVSSSMSGTKLSLLKHAMSFVIQHLGSSDRLSVVTFSSTARRLFPLRRMSNSGRQQALDAVNSLVCDASTNIAEGLRKGAKVIEERRMRNPVCSIILLSDGQDNCTLLSGRRLPDYSVLVPSSIRDARTHQIPVHAFGFGLDHDSAALHSISEVSGGTFSFIESEIIIQDAFAQCIGGLLSVIVQGMQVFIGSGHPGVQIAQIQSGNYTNHVSENAQSGSINVGDLYADEERDFLISVNIPPANREVVLLRVGCCYKDPISNEVVTSEVNEVKIQRPDTVTAQTPSIEVDRERNRVEAAEAMSVARAAAERGALPEAISILEGRRRILSESLAGRSGDMLCLGLDAELREMQERMASRQMYESSGRAYLLSGLSSHSRQRATARGDSTDMNSPLGSYRTPSMVSMLQLSQTLTPSPRARTPPVQHSSSSPDQP